MKTSALLLTTTAALVAAVPPLRAQTATPTPPPTPGYVAAFQPSATQPLADREARTATRLSTRLTVGEAQLLQNFRGLYNEVWHNPDGLTPQQVCDALGSKASNLFVIAGTMANALYQIDPVGLGAMVSVPAGYAASINADGTVAITHPAPAATPKP